MYKRLYTLNKLLYNSNSWGSWDIHTKGLSMPLLCSV